MKKLLFIILLLQLGYAAVCQTQIFKIKVVDAVTKEPVAGAVLKTATTSFTTATDGTAAIAKNEKQFSVTAMGYQGVSVSGNVTGIISLQPVTGNMQEVVVTANREATQRSQAPVAINILNKQVIEDTKAQRLDFLLNKVSGVFMVNLGNEQHEMSIRQPMTTKSLFLYMEDGIPIRTTGVYNHNALLEMNLTAVKNIEVVKGPSSALYGAEAIGGAVNVITQSAPAFSSGKLSLQLNDKGYKRADAQYGTSFGKWGILVSGYYANKHNGPIEFSDFNKTAFTLRTDYRAGENTAWTNTFAIVDYNSDMSGSIDSLKFASKNYTSQQAFTYRKVYALRYKSMLSHQWTSRSNTSLAFMFRDNSVKQNPSYSIGSTANPAKFKGQINDNAFKTYALFATHVQKLPSLKSKLIAGASVDFSPQTYYAKFISITKDLALNKYVSYTSPVPDSFLSKYRTGIVNIAAYADYEYSPVKNLKITAAVRYDAFQYYFINNLPGSASVSTASTVNSFSRVTPKIGFTYNYKGIGFYSNYSQGYVPPQLTELYSSVKVAPYLLPQTFNNYELGGWISLLKNKLYADWSVYRLLGTNEIISVKQPDNTSANESAGSTKHTGVEYGITYKPADGLSIRFSGTNAKHTYIKNVVKGVDYNGKEMSGAPRFTSNAEVMYKPPFVKGLRISAEWQHQGKYFMDDLDKYTYKGFDIVNLRAGYQYKMFEVWVNAINAGNLYYSTFSSKNATSSGSPAYSYSLGDPREITIGLAYSFGKK